MLRYLSLNENKQQFLWIVTLSLIIFFIKNSSCYDLKLNCENYLFSNQSFPPLRSNQFSTVLNNETLILFGGVDSSGPSNEIWEFNTIFEKWKNRKTDTWIGTDSSSTIISNERIFIVGPSIDGKMNPVYIYDLKDGLITMEIVNKDKKPCKRGHTITYSPESNLIYLFGGEDCDNSKLSSDLYSLSLSGLNANTKLEWNLINPSDLLKPSPRFYHTSLYDSNTNSLIVIGGLTESLDDCHEDVWSYDISNNKWTKITENYSFRKSHVVGVNHPMSSNFLMIGGQCGSNINTKTKTNILSFNYEDLYVIDYTEISNCNVDRQQSKSTLSTSLNEFVYIYPSTSMEFNSIYGVKIGKELKEKEKNILLLQREYLETDSDHLNYYNLRENVTEVTTSEPPPVTTAQTEVTTSLITTDSATTGVTTGNQPVTTVEPEATTQAVVTTAAVDATTGGEVGTTGVVGSTTAVVAATTGVVGSTTGLVGTTGVPVNTATTANIATTGVTTQVFTSRDITTVGTPQSTSTSTSSGGTSSGNDGDNQTPSNYFPYSVIVVNGVESRDMPIPQALSSQCASSTPQNCRGSVILTLFPGQPFKALFPIQVINPKIMASWRFTVRMTVMNTNSAFNLSLINPTYANTNKRQTSPTNGISLNPSPIQAGVYQTFSVNQNDFISSIKPLFDENDVIYVQITSFSNTQNKLYIDVIELSTCESTVDECFPAKNPDDDSKGSKIGLIVGVSVGAVVFVIIVAIIVFVLIRNKKKKNHKPKDLEFESELKSLPIPYMKNIIIGEKLGAGNFGDVFKGTAYGGTTQVALKRLKAELMNEFLSEASILMKLKHPHCVLFLGIFMDKPDERYIVTEYCENGSLLDLLEKRRDQFNLLQLVELAQGATKGMAYLEEMSIVHRDLSARNILVDGNGVAKVADFGLSRALSNEIYTSKGGKFPVRWSAPEVIKFSKFSSKSDVWSMGITFYEIFTYGRVPYGGMSNEEVIEKVVENNYRMPKPNECPENIWAIIKSCWETNPADRPSFKVISKQISNLIGTKTINNFEQRLLKSQSETGGPHNGALGTMNSSPLDTSLSHSQSTVPHRVYSEDLSSDNLSNRYDALAIKENHSLDRSSSLDVTSAYTSGSRPTSLSIPTEDQYARLSYQESKNSQEKH